MNIKNKIRAALMILVTVLLPNLVGCGSIDSMVQGAKLDEFSKLLQEGDKDKINAELQARTDIFKKSFGGAR